MIVRCRISHTRTAAAISVPNARPKTPDETASAISDGSQARKALCRMLEPIRAADVFIATSSILEELVFLARPAGRPLPRRVGWGPVGLY